MTATITWLTPSGLIGVYPASIAMTYKLQATIIGGTLVDYKIISGSLPAGLSFRDDGKIFGTPNLVVEDATSTFVVRITATDGSTQSIKDRTFSLTITGEATPFITTNDGSLGSIPDSTWFELPIDYVNPIADNPVIFRITQGQLPPGLEINEFGLIRGYADPPEANINLPFINTLTLNTNGTNSYLTVLSTANFTPNRPITFTAPTIGGLLAGVTYYVKEVINATQITLTTIPDGPLLALSTGSGFMNTTLPAVTVGQPTKIQYSFTVDLISPKGSDKGFYTITVYNQNLNPTQGNPYYTVTGARVPTIYNTRPPTYNIEADSVNYGYYVLPPVGSVTPQGLTYSPTQEAYIGQFQSDKFFSFHILGHDFDNQELIYEYSGLPSWITANPTSGWIYGDPSIAIDTIEDFSFSVRVSKTIGGTQIVTPFFNFKFEVANNITSDIVWETNSNLGTFYNSTISYQDIVATADVPLQYSKISGSLPPNLTLKDNGEIVGKIAYQPTNNFEDYKDSSSFQFTVRAFAQDANLANIITSTRTFTMNVLQEFENPTDNLYIRCSPGLEGRTIIDSLLTDNYLIPNEYLYRPDDYNFGKAKDVTYAHAYGIHASNLSEYIAAVEKNHYWRNIILGSLNTAIARDSNGNILYEVVYSNVIDNLMKYDPTYGVDYRYAVSISEEIFWPRFIDLNLGPWYTSSTEIYTSYIFAQDAYIITNFREYNLLTQDGIPLMLNQGVPTFNTNLSPGYARVLYPNSLDNMRKRVEQELGANFDFRKLPLWMTSQQRDGNTLGFTPAWVICYTKPSPTIPISATQTIGTSNAIVLESIDGISVDGEIMFAGSTFGNILSNQIYYVKSIGVPGYPNSIVVSETKGGDAYDLFTETGTMNGTFYAGSYASIIKSRIENDWAYKLNMVNFQIDRFTVDKEMTFDYNNYVEPNVWVEYPSASPTPNPVDSQNFYVLFPRKTILPTRTQYNL